MKNIEKVTSVLSKYRLEIFLSLFFFFSHLPGLGHEIFNTDVWRWKTRTYNFGQGVFTLDFENTIQTYHPGVTLMWVGTVAVKFFNAYNEIFLGHPPLDNQIQTVFGLHFTQKLFLVAFLALILGFCFHVLKEHFGKRFCIIFAFLLTLEPLYYAMTRVFHLEGLMTTLMLASFLWYYHFLQNPKKFRLIISALFGSLAVLTKTTAIYMIPFIGLLTLLEMILGNNSQKSVLALFTPILQWVLCFVFFFVAFWPAMWVAPAEALKELYGGVSLVGIEGGHEQVYFGQITWDPGAFFYFVAFFYRSSPFLLLGMLGSLFSIKSFNSKEKKFWLYAVLFSLFYFIQITIPTKKLDRYILPTQVGFILASTFFYTFLLSKLGKKRGSLVLGLVFLALSWNIFSLKRDYFSYFNPLAGGLKRGIYVLEPKWMIGQHEIVNHFSKLKPGLIIAFPEKYYTQVFPFIKEIGDTPVIDTITPEAKEADFFVYPVWGDTSQLDSRFKLIYQDSIYLRGVEVYKIYVK